MAICGHFWRTFFFRALLCYGWHEHDSWRRKATDRGPTRHCIAYIAAIQGSSPPNISQSFLSFQAFTLGEYCKNCSPKEHRSWTSRLKGEKKVRIPVSHRTWQATRSNRLQASEYRPLHLRCQTSSISIYIAQLSVHITTNFSLT